MTTNRIKIATIIWKDSIGGAERFLNDLAAAIDKEKFQMVFYYLSGSSGHFSEKIHSIGFDTNFLNWKNGFDITGRIRLIRMLKEFRPDIIHDHILPPLTRSFLKIFLSTPIVATEHGEALQQSLGHHEKWRKLLSKIDWFFCDCVAANSLTSATALKKVYNIPDSKIKIIPLGINTDYFKPNLAKKRKTNYFKIGFVGRISNKHKGVDFLPFIAKYLKKYYNIRFKFLVAGDGPDLQNIEKSCYDNEIIEHFHFFGWISDVQKFLNKIDILVIPSRYEPLGLAAIEALSMNIPVIAFDVGGLHEILSESPIGRLVNPGNLLDFAKEIHSVLQNIEEVGNSGRQYVLESFSNIITARKYESIYINYILKRHVKFFCR